MYERVINYFEMSFVNETGCFLKIIELYKTIVIAIDLKVKKLYPSIFLKSPQS